MTRSTGAKVTISSYNTASANNGWSFRAPMWIRQLTNLWSTSRTGTSRFTGSLPHHNASNQSSNATSTVNTPIPPGSELFLLACAHKSQRQKHLLQDTINSVSTDQVLFLFLKQQLKRNQSRIRSLLSMRSVQGMYFVKVSPVQSRPLQV